MWRKDLVYVGISEVLFSVFKKFLTVSINTPLLQMRKLRIRGVTGLQLLGLVLRLRSAWVSKFLNGLLWGYLVAVSLHTFPALGEFSITGVHAFLRWDLETCCPSLPGHHGLGM